MKLDSFQFNNTEIKFECITGEVINSAKHSQTSVTSSGGGGYVSRNGGQINAPTIHSESVTCHDFWLRLDNGREVDVQLKGVDIPMRPGQVISLITYHVAGDSKIYYAILVNHSAQKHWYIVKGINVNRTHNLISITNANILTLIGVLAVGGYFGGIVGSLVPAATVGIVGYIYKWKSARELISRIDKHFEKIVQNVYHFNPKKDVA